MESLIDSVSETLNLPPAHIITIGIKAFLEREIRLTESDIADLREKYLVVSPKELEAKIINKKIPSHPAWENSEKYILQIKDILKRDLIRECLKSS